MSRDRNWPHPSVAYGPGKEEQQGSKLLSLYELTSDGYALYTQSRHGRSGKDFLYKFGCYSPNRHRYQKVWDDLNGDEADYGSSVGLYWFSS